MNLNYINYRLIAEKLLMKKTLTATISKINANIEPFTLIDIIIYLI